MKKFGQKLVKLLQDQGYLAFFVGGFVRNQLLGLTSDNLDIATNALPNGVEALLNKARVKNKPIGKEFGTILALSKSDKAEITTFRTEGRYKDRRHPSFIEFTDNLELDAKRRDFTINALYFNPQTRELLDPKNGLKDLKAKLIRFVGNPKKRIDEDALRMLRAVRIAIQLNFRIERNSFAAIKTRAKFIQHISGERIKAELDKILLLRNRVEGIKLLDTIGLLKFIIPEIIFKKTFSNFDHAMLAFSKVNKVSDPNLNLLYALLFHDIFSTKGRANASADIFKEFAKKLSFPKNDAKNTEWLIRNHMLMFDFSTMGLIKQLRLVKHPMFIQLSRHWELMDDHHRKYLTAKKISSNLLRRLNKKKKLIKQLANGDVIMRHSKFAAGPKLGKKIKEVEAKILQGVIKNEKGLKNYLKS